MKSEFTARNKMHSEGNTYSFLFYCHYCGAGYTTSPITTKNEYEAFTLAKRRAQPYFNLCHKCRKWVCDAHYNENFMQCIECAPKSEQINYSDHMPY